MQTQKMRYVFINYDGLQHVALTKLKKVNPKIFVFIEATEAFIPLTLVKRLQPFGDTINWIPVHANDKDSITYHMAFYMGELNQKENKAIEFVVVSNDLSFDPLIHYINETGRRCFRVNRKRHEEDGDLDDNLGDREAGHPEKPRGSKLGNLDSDVFIKKTAEETLNRLIRSGNRPLNIDALKEYILLHNQELSLYTNVDKIIQKLEQNKEISIHSGEVQYNF